MEFCFGVVGYPVQEVGEALQQSGLKYIGAHYSIAEFLVAKRLSCIWYKRILSNQPPSALFDPNVSVSKNLCSCCAVQLGTQSSRLGESKPSTTYRRLIFP